MPVDLLKEIIGLKKAYSSMRGGNLPAGIRGPDGFLVIPPGFMVPRTTWGDIMIAARHIDKYADPTVDQCVELLMKHEGWGRTKATLNCGMFGERGVSPRAFQRTSAFNQAQKNFRNFNPYKVAARITGGPFAGMVYAVGKIATNEIYPNNEEFWGYAIRYMKERVLAGDVPFWGDMALESIQEAIEDLPDTLRASAAAAFSVVGNLVPDVSGIVALIRWGSILGGLGLLYWYALRPKKKQ